MYNDLIAAEQEVVLTLVKIGFITFLVLYSVFAAVVIKQARIMSQTLKVGFETQIKYLALIHFALSLVILLLSFLIL